jgi:hypothetical protein
MSARKDSVLDRRLRRLSSVIVIVGAVAALLAATRVSFALGSQTVQGKTLQYNVRFVRDSQIDLGARGASATNGPSTTSSSTKTASVWATRAVSVRSRA